ncbi:hypothetical protein BH11ACT6_BH11ACT6_01840 [soil metagenome]
MIVVVFVTVVTLTGTLVVRVPEGVLMRTGARTVLTVDDVRVLRVAIMAPFIPCRKLRKKAHHLVSNGERQGGLGVASTLHANANTREALDLVDTLH